MAVFWGIHNDRPNLDLVENGFVGIGWPGIGDISALGDDRDSIKARVAEVFPDAKPGAIPVWAGVLRRFAYEMEIGDLVVYPHKPDSTVNIGRVAGPYSFVAGEAHPHRRDVEWVSTDIPRTRFSQAARNEIGSAVTMFRIRSNAAEFESVVNGTVPEVDPDVVPDDSIEDAVEHAAQAITAERIEQHTRDFIVSTLMSELDHFEFEEFVADLLIAMGYEARVTQKSGDGGIDVLAHRDELGLEPPLIKVQCKHTEASKGGPDVQQLTGTLAPGGAELGLYVTLGSYSKDARSLERSRSDLRLVTGDDVVDLVTKHYEQLDPRWKRLIPLRQVFVVDQDPEAG
ncbi:restriction endonuclease [Ilumatobacter sp.]|uniref:restriction endonuclease n=1 Tax=Ilumatobacter sp. TaxID=1967498 RepID=UPI003B520BC0